FNFVSPGYFDTVGMRLVSGRGIETRDISSAPPVTVINEAMARRYFGSQDPIGKHLDWNLPSGKEKVDHPQEQPMEIDGVVADAKYNNVRRETKPMFWVPIEQFGRTLRSIEIRSTLPAAALTAPVRQALRDVVPAAQMREIATLEGQVEATLAPERIIA